MLRSRSVIGTWGFVEVVATDSEHVECRWNVILRTLCILSRNCRSLHKWLIEPDRDIGSITFYINDVIEINIRGTVICKSRVLHTSIPLVPYDRSRNFHLMTLSEISGNCEFESLRASGRRARSYIPGCWIPDNIVVSIVSSGFYESVVTCLNIHTFESPYVSFSRNFNNSRND